MDHFVLEYAPIPSTMKLPCIMGGGGGGLKSQYRLTMTQWSNLTKCGLFFNIVSPAVHTLLPSVLQHLDSRDVEALILILEKVFNCRV